MAGFERKEIGEEGIKKDKIENATRIEWKGQMIAFFRKSTDV